MLTLVMRSISAAPDLLAGRKAAKLRDVPLLSCSKYLLVSSCDITQSIPPTVATPDKGCEETLGSCPGDEGKKPRG